MRASAIPSTPGSAGDAAPPSWPTRLISMETAMPTGGCIRSNAVPSARVIEEGVGAPKRPTRRSFVEGERRDSNPRPPGPQPSGRPARERTQTARLGLTAGRWARGRSARLHWPGRRYASLAAAFVQAQEGVWNASCDASGVREVSSQSSNKRYSASQRGCGRSTLARIWTKIGPTEDLQSDVPVPTKPCVSRAFARSGRQDLNLRPPGPQPGALPDCATPRDFASGRRESNPP